MNLDQIQTQCFILSLFIRDDGQRFLLGSGAYEFKDTEQHFDANTYANDVVEVQGNDGVFLAGQVRRPSAQTFDGYIGDATVSKADIEEYRKDFLAFFRKNYYYTVVYIFPNGEAIQRRKGFIVDAPEVKELYQVFPEYHIALNFEDINYYSYSEDSEGQETYTKSATISPASGATSGGLVWDSIGATIDPMSSWITPVEVEGSSITITNSEAAAAPVKEIVVKGNASQQSTPTPSAPQSVNTVTGTQTVTIMNGEDSDSYTMTLGSIELCKVGDYQDYIYKSSGNWYLHKEVRHLSLAVVDMNNDNNYPGWQNVTDILNDLGADLNTSLDAVTSQMNNFISDPGVSPRINTVTSQGTNAIFIRASNFPNLTQAQWKSTYPDLVCEIYYGIINTPADTQITDATLIAELETLEGVTLAPGTNTVASAGTGTNLPAVMDITYYSELDDDTAPGFVWEEGTGGGPVTVMVDSIDRVYPIWEIRGPATNPQLSVLTTGTVTTYNGTVTASQTLQIDMFNKTAKLNGVSVVGNITGDWAYFSPGNNRVIYTTQNPDAIPSTIYWQEIVG